MSQGLYATLLVVMFVLTSSYPSKSFIKDMSALLFILLTWQKSDHALVVLCIITQMV